MATAKETVTTPDELPKTNGDPNMVSVTMVNGQVYSGAVQEGPRFLVRNIARSTGHYMDGSNCVEIEPGQFKILDHQPGALSVELQVQSL